MQLTEQIITNFKASLDALLGSPVDRQAIRTALEGLFVSIGSEIDQMVELAAQQGISRATAQVQIHVDADGRSPTLIWPAPSEIVDTVKAALLPAPSPQGERLLSQVEVRGLLSDQEWVAIESVPLDTTFDLAARAAAAALLRGLSMTPLLRLSDPYFTGAIEFLVQIQRLTPARAAQVLAGLPAASQQP